MNLIPQPLEAFCDEAPILAFLRGRQSWTPPPAYWRSGKSILGTYLTLAEGPPSNHWFWLDECGRISAYTWLIPQERAWRLHIHPDSWGPDVAARLLCYAEGKLGSLQDRTDLPLQPQSAAYLADKPLVSLLRAHGYVRGECIDVYMVRSLKGWIPAPESRTDFLLRETTAQDSVRERASVHVDAFSGQHEPSPRIVALIERLLQFCECRDGVDLVMAGPSQELAAFATLVMDPVTELGEFDPVGTRAVYQRRGLGKALMLAGMRRMRERGMRYAVVRTGADNHPAMELYRALGFTEVDRLYQFVKVE